MSRSSKNERSSNLQTQLDELRESLRQFEADGSAARHSSSQSWRKPEFVTSVVATVTAVAALLYTVAQDQSSADAIAAAQEAFEASVQPSVIFSEYQWVAEPTGRGCEQPAFGINAYVKNFSDYPVLLHSLDLRITSMGKPLTVSGMEQVETKSSLRPSLLAPGEQMSAGNQGDAIAEIYSRLRSPSENPGGMLLLHISAIYQSTITKRAYRYSEQVEIVEDCRLPYQKQFGRGNVAIEEISVDEIGVIGGSPVRQTLRSASKPGQLSGQPEP